MRLQAFSMVLALTFAFSLQAQTNRATIIKEIQEAREITNRWMDLKQFGLRSKDVFEGQSERADYHISGIPEYVREIKTEGVTFRHYVTSNMDIILKTSQLKTGITPYVIISPGFSREVYLDIVGMFLTTPQTPPGRIGLKADDKMDYIDFTLYKGTPVVQIEPEIFVIPGRPDIPEWLKKVYLDYKKTGRVNIQYIELFKKIDSRGGVNPTFMTINIKKYRLNGKVFTVEN